MPSTQPSWAHQWAGALLLGVWLSVTAVWPMALVPVGRMQLMWQPLLLLTLTILVLLRGRRAGWGPAIGRSLWMFVVFTVAAWLPFLHQIPASPPSYPAFYTAYLLLYEGGLAMLVGWQAALAGCSRQPSWWTVDGWSKPLVVAPILMALRSLHHSGDWLAPVVGLGLGAGLGIWQRRRGWTCRLSPWVWRLIPVGLFIVAGLLVFVAALRMYSLTGPGEPGTQTGFPAASDDGPAYYSLGLAISKDPRLLFTSQLGDQLFFTGYSILMGLWFWLWGGPHIPSWLLWHGVAGGALAVAVYGIGRKLTGQAVLGVVAGCLVVADHIMLQLLGTMNQETFFFALIYAALLLWSQTTNPDARLRVGFFAGLMMGVSVVFRTASLMLPFAWCLCLLWERPRRDVRLVRAQAWMLLLGVFIPVALMVIRHRIAWGYWTLSGIHAEGRTVGFNYALRLHDVHLTDVGLVGWLQRLAAEPQLLWQHVIPSWWKQGVYLWTHRGFGQMDFVQGLNAPGAYQAALMTILSVSALVGAVVAIRRRARLDVALLSLPLCFTSLVLVFYVLNSRYRSPFIPALYLLSCLGLSLPWMTARSRDPASGHAPESEAPDHELLSAATETLRAEG